MENMIWDARYELTALSMLILFLVFYQLQRSLPLKKNRVFMGMLVAELSCILWDLIASYISTWHMRYPTWMLEISNMLYFFFLISVYYLFSVYCRCTARERAADPILRWWQLRVPLWFATAVLISNPWTKAIYDVSRENGYVRGWMYYYLIPEILILYTVISLSFVLYYRKYLSIREKGGLYAFVICTMLTSMLQIYFFPYLLITNIGLSTGVAINYLAMQNPEFDKDRKTRNYNLEGFGRYTSEQLRMGKEFQCMAIGFANYKTLLSIYGSQKMDRLLNRIGIRLRNRYNHAVTFYIHNGRFVLVFPRHIQINPIEAELIAYFDRNFGLNKDVLQLNLRLAYLYADKRIKKPFDIGESLDMALDDACRKEIYQLKVVDDALMEKLYREREYNRALHDAIEKDHVEVFYQPIYDSKCELFTMAEALVRIRDPKLGLLFPDAFISIAEKDGTILSLGKIVFRKVCRFIKEHDLDALGIQAIEVNLSPIQCRHRFLAEDYLKIAEEYGIDLNNIVFEITETATVGVDRMGKMMQQLQKAGARFALDDYGTGYSNMINVMSLPFYCIKIDKSLVWSYFRQEDWILPKFVRIFKDDSLTIVAEGAETMDMTDGLIEMGCDYVQGFYYSKPVEEKVFLEFLKSHNETRKE